jgi:copper chaperone CopZ
MCCDKESALIERKLGPVKGIIDIDINVIGRILYTTFDEKEISPEEILTILNNNNLGASLATLGMDESKPEKVNIMLIISMTIAVVSFIVLIIIVNI